MTVTTTYGYNDAKMLSGLQTFAPGGSIINEYRHTYDNNGNWTQVQSNAGTVSYTYDSLNRLTSETLLDGTLIEYTYDAAGNRLTKKVTRGGSVTTTGYQYGAANQLTSAGGVNYTYDDNGNMTGDGTRTYLYDAANRLLEVKQGINSIAMFAYDADGRRTSMTTSSGTTRFFYDGASTRVLYETDGNNNLLARYVYGPGGQLLAMVRGGVTYYYHYNGHGDVVALTNAAGTVVATYEYDAFGNHIGSTGSVNNPYRYAGYRWDAETGLYYLNARYYLPSVGRFITRDAFHGFEDDPASLNWYNYAHSNPVMFVDPSGYYPILAVLIKLAKPIAIKGWTALVTWGAKYGALGQKVITKVGLSVFGPSAPQVINSKVNYVLTAPGKKGGFANIGYNLKNADALRRLLLSNGNTLRNLNPTVHPNGYGMRYTQTLLVTGPNGKQGWLVTQWQVDWGTRVPRLITAWVKSF